MTTLNDQYIVGLQVPAGVSDYVLSSYESASLLLVIQGSASAANASLGGSTLDLCKGRVLFISAGESLTLNVASQDGILMFRAYCQL